MEGWEKFARRLADTGYHVFITGSNAKMLSQEIAGKLGARYYLTEVFPYSFKEYLTSSGLELNHNWEYNQESAIKRAFFEYFKMGGLPEVASTETKFKRRWLSGLFDRIYLGDIVLRHNIRKPDSLKCLIRKVADSIGQPLTSNRAASMVSAGGYSLKPDTANEYLGYMAEAFLSLPIENFAVKLDEKVSTKKYYLIDNGLISLFCDTLKGELLENLVAVTLRREYPLSVYYYKYNIEVDFFVPEEDAAWQVCYDISDENTKLREIKALKALHAYHPLKSATIVTYEEEDTILADDLIINIIPIWKWLLK